MFTRKREKKPRTKKQFVLHCAKYAVLGALSPFFPALCYFFSDDAKGVMGYFTAPFGYLLKFLTILFLLFIASKLKWVYDFKSKEK